MKRKSVEFAIQAKVGGTFEDVDVFNKRTCLWTIPVDSWADEIKKSYMIDHAKRHYKNVRLVKRVTTEEIVK